MTPGRRGFPATPARILVIDDDAGIGEAVPMLLESDGHVVRLVQRGNQGVEAALQGPFDLVITDLRLPDRSGIEVTRAIHAALPDLPIIMMTSYSSIENAVEALRTGAVDYVIKPFANDEFRFAVSRALNERRILRENAALRRELKDLVGERRIIGESPGIRQILDLIARVAPSDASILIEGESGTGKELVAQAIHGASRRAGRPMIPINCGAIPADLVESELFGHARGAFTGAVETTEGLIREADGGTVFLDEVGELAPAIQVKLLRVLQEREVRPVGGRSSHRVDVRFIAATNRNLAEAVAAGSFRADLFYRLNVISMRMPALRERGADIDMLARHFARQACQRLGKRVMTLSRSLLDQLHGHDWPGNVRELENIIERSVILADGPELELSGLLAGRQETDKRATSVRDASLADEAGIEDYIRAFVLRYQDTHTEIELADKLGIGRKALWMRRRRWSLFRKGHAPRQSPD